MKVIQIKAKDFFEFIKLKDTSMWEIFSQMIDGEEKEILFLDEEEKVLFSYILPKNLEKLEEDKGQYNDETEIFWASGCALFIRKEDYWSMNGLDERFFAHQEEIDLCWRLKNAGRKVYYCGKSTVFHVGGGTLNKQSPQKTYLNIRNNLSMLLKNLPIAALLWVIPVRLILDGIAGIYFGLKDGFPHLWAVVRAHFGFYAQAPKTWKLRSSSQIKDYYQTKWLIFKHFL